MNDDRVNRAKEIFKQLTDAEKKYSEEVKQIRDKQEKNESIRAERDYKIQLSKASTEVQYEKVKQDRIFRLQKEADEKRIREMKEALDAQTEQREEQFRNLKYELDAGIISEQDYYSELAVLRDTYFEEGSERWQKYSLDIINYNRRTAEECQRDIAAMTGEMTEILDSAENKIAKSREKIRENLKNYTGLFDTTTMKYKKMGAFGSDFVITKTTLADIEKQTAELIEYRDALVAVRDRSENLPAELFKELKELDVGTGLRFAKTLLEADDKEFEDYTDSYKKQREVIAEISRELTRGETERTIADMKEKLAEVYGDIPEEFYSCGLDSADGFGEAFIGQLDGIFDRIKSVIADNMAEITPTAVSAGGAYKPVSSYTASYNFYGSGETVAGQLQAARAAAVVERMRGGYDI